MIELIDSWYDAVSGLSKVVINTDCGKFFGIANVHPEDKDIASNFLGCEIAEYRATIKYLEKKKKLLSHKIVALKDLEKDFKKYKLDIYSKEYQTLLRRLSQMEHQKLEYQKDIKSLKDFIENKLDNRIIIIEKINKIKNKNKDSK